MAATRAPALSPADRPSAAARLAERVGLRPPALTGVRHALEAGHGSTSVPVRSVLAGSVIGVAGVAAVLTFVAGIGHLFDTPRLWGATFQADIERGSDLSALDGAVADLTSDPDIDAVAVDYVIEGATVVAHGKDFAVDVDVVEQKHGNVPVVVTDGVAPVGPDEVAVGRGRLREFDLDLGDTLEVKGESGVIRFRIVGQSVTPGIDTIDSSVVATGAALESLGADRVTTAHLFVRAEPGADTAAIEARHDGLSFDTERPSIIDNLDELGSLPAALAAFLAALATAAAAHGLASAVRRRRRDLAVLRSLGLTRGQVAFAIHWQAVVIAAVGLLVGLPLGVALGRQVFRVVADSIGVVVEPILPALALALMVPAAFALALLVSALPGRTASRVRPGTVLRAE